MLKELPEYLVFIVRSVMDNCKRLAQDSADTYQISQEIFDTLTRSNIIQKMTFFSRFMYIDLY